MNKDFKDQIENISFSSLNNAYFSDAWSYSF